MSKLRVLTTLFLLATVLCGCEKPPELGTVTGTVSMGGEPLGEVRVLFVPVPGDGGEGVYSDCYTGDDGKYELIYSGVNTEIVKGALLGTHSVAVEDAKAEESRGALEIRIPDRYSSGARSPLKFEVKAGANTYDIELPEIR